MKSIPAVLLLILALLGVTASTIGAQATIRAESVETASESKPGKSTRTHLAVGIADSLTQPWAIAELIRRSRGGEDFILLRRDAVSADTLSAALAFFRAARRRGDKEPNRPFYGAIGASNYPRSSSAADRAWAATVIEQLASAPTESIPSVGRVKAKRVKYPDSP